MADRRTSLVLDMLIHSQIVYRFIGHIETWSAATVAQNVRQHAAALDWIRAEDWLLLSDADLWPLTRDFYHQHDDFAGRMVSLYSNGDHFAGKKDVLERFRNGNSIQSLPTCHVIMRAKDWRQIYDIQKGDTVNAATARTLEKMKSWIKDASDPGLALWCIDQWYATVLTCQQIWFGDTPPPMSPVPPGGRILKSPNVMLVERAGHPPADRLDRGRPWVWPFEKDKWTDAHIFKSPFAPKQWKQIVPVIDVMLPEHSQWIRNYREEYVR